VKVDVINMVNLEGCSVEFFNNTVSYLKKEYGGRFVDEDKLNRFIEHLGEAERIYIGMNGKVVDNEINSNEGL